MSKTDKKRFHVNGIFGLEVEAEDYREAKATALRILRTDGIDGYVLDVEEARTNE